MKKLFILLCTIYLVVNQPVLSAASDVQDCYYAEPIEQKVDGNFFQKLIVQGYDENETFESIEKHLRDSIPFSHRFQFKYPLKDKSHAQIFAKVMQIKAQEAHRFVPVIDLSQFTALRHLGFIREIKIMNDGPRIQEHVLVDQESPQVIFIEEWAIGSNNIVTYNLSDFPPSALSKYEIDAQHPDEFLRHLLDLAPDKVIATVQETRKSLKNRKSSRSHGAAILRSER